MLTGSIEKILTQKEDDWGRYAVSAQDGKEYLCVGTIPSASLHMDVCLDGKEEVTRWGRQFAISSVIYAKQDRFSGIRRFLTDGYLYGIGIKRAEVLINTLGDRVFDLFDPKEGIAQLLSASGIKNEESLKKLSNSYEENKKYKDIVIFLNGQCSKKQVEAIYKMYGDGAVKTLKENPYRLQYDIKGFGFKKADTIALASGVKTDDLIRLEAAIYYVLKKAETDGNCFLDKDEAVTQAKEELVAMIPMTDLEREDRGKITKKIIENAIKDWGEKKKNYLVHKYKVSQDTIDKISEMVHSRDLINERIEDALQSSVTKGYIISDKDRLYTKEMYKTECTVAKMLSDLAGSSSVRKVPEHVIESAIRKAEERKTAEMGSPFIATEEQKEAVRLGLSNRISIISGGPGRGKTAISEMIADAFLMAGDEDKKDIIMLAPTGRAAQRITESTGYESMTAHRAVYKAWRRAKRLVAAGEDPIGAYPKGKLVLCDETSMLDINWMKNVLEYARNCNIIFVGDVDQIASVGPGKVLKDMIDSKVIPYILLKQGHRNSGTIAENSVKINRGSRIRDLIYDDTFVYTGCTKDNIVDVIIRDYKDAVRRYGLQDVMLCTAMRDRGPVNVSYLNKRLQRDLSSGRAYADFGNDRVYFVGDRVMHTKNNYDFIKIKDGTRYKGVFNGEKGTVVKICADKETGDPCIVVAFDDGSFGGYSGRTIGELTLAYVTTVHKCQGSEAKCMMMAYTFGDYKQMSRSLFYTGETRAKKEFRFYGEEQLRYGHMMSAFDLAVKRLDDKKRNTALAEKIREYSNVE